MNSKEILKMHIKRHNCLAKKWLLWNNSDGAKEIADLHFSTAKEYQQELDELLKKENK